MRTKSLRRGYNLLQLLHANFFVSLAFVNLFDYIPQNFDLLFFSL